MSLLYKRLRANTTILSIQSGRNWLPASRSLSTNLQLWRHTLCPLISRSKKLWSKSTPRAAAEEMSVHMEEGRISSQIWVATSVARREISRNNEGQRELALMVTHPRSPQPILHNGSLRSLLFNIPKILKHPPWSTITRSTSGAPLAIMVMVHGDFTGSMATMSVKISKARNHLFIFKIPLPMQSYISPT